MKPRKPKPLPEDKVLYCAACGHHKEAHGENGCIERIPVFGKKSGQFDKCFCKTFLKRGV